VDEVCWLRGSEVKASLRFWWRALFGHAYPTSKELHEAESKRFGSAKGNEGVVSPVAVSVKERSRGGIVDATAITDVRKLAYYPGAGEILLQGKAAISLAFRRGILKTHRKEIESALIAWLLFGGAGARTRRGVGALAPATKCDAEKIGYPSDPDLLAKFLGNLPKNSTRCQYFTLANGAEFLCSTQGSAAERAHQNLMDHWRAFRQNRMHPNNFMGRNGWGLSAWPEPDIVRKRRILVGGRPRHMALMAPSNEGKSPRMLLGAPMLLHWKTGNSGEGIADAEFGLSFLPPGAPRGTLRKFVDRYASPVLIGVARFWDAQDRAEHRGLILATEATFHLAGGAPALKEAPEAILATGGFQPVTNRGVEGYPVSDASSMVGQVARAFQTPSDSSVALPHFQIIR
jgi:CRISPR type III-B/RAMP module RAMP protein Cmr1